MNSPGTAGVAPHVPLCVDLDGTLSPVDTFHESLLSLARHAPASLVLLPGWRRAGINLKEEVAVRGRFDASLVPLHGALLDWLTEEKARGRRLILVSGAAPSIVAAIAARVGLFDEILPLPASGATNSLDAHEASQTLVGSFGEKGFDYVGNGKTAAAVWTHARRAIVVGSDQHVERVRTLTDVEKRFPPERRTWAAWIHAVRLHQWAKNLLIFLPALLAHRILQSDVFAFSGFAFLSFSLCASSIYVINDLFDLASDRRHVRKRSRPFAAGILSARSGIVVSLGLLAGSACLSLIVGARFVAVLGTYYAVTWAYSMRLKRAALVDVMTLAVLYTLRIIAGSAATGIRLSFWLLAFSVFIFLSLAIVKRYTEINDAAVQGGSPTHGRGYRVADLPLLLTLGVAAGYCTVVVMALYINSMEATLIYQRTKPLWLICPLLLYWISRIWLLTTRGEMPDDPVVFALRDRVSLWVLGLVVAIVLLAI